MNNKTTYYVVNGDGVIATVYSHEEYGRTLVIHGQINPNFPIEVMDRDSKKLADGDLIEFFQSMIPMGEPNNEKS